MQHTGLILGAFVREVLYYFCCIVVVVVVCLFVFSWEGQTDLMIRPSPLRRRHFLIFRAGNGELNLNELCKIII